MQAHSSPPQLAPPRLWSSVQPVHSITMCAAGMTATERKIKLLPWRLCVFAYALHSQLPPRRHTSSNPFQISMPPPEPFILAI